MHSGPDLFHDSDLFYSSPSGLAVSTLCCQADPSDKAAPTAPMYSITTADEKILMQAHHALTNNLSSTAAAAHYEVWTQMSKVVGHPLCVKADGWTSLIKPLTSAQTGQLRSAIYKTTKLTDGQMAWYLSWLRVACMLTVD